MYCNIEMANVCREVYEKRLGISRKGVINFKKRFANHDQCVHGLSFLSLITFQNCSVLYELLGYFKIKDWLLRITCIAGTAKGMPARGLVLNYDLLY